ncbi:hypothetical protein UMZ34_16710 [Halopseudomonas pachastrellae]|nr:hypothetical protein UMZ34_16710 [Halopseudomonas pachastrellae]
MSNDPSKTTPAVDAMREDWAVVDPLMNGTKGMRAAGTALLPKWPKEDVEAYKARLSASTLLPAYSETVASMTGGCSLSRLPLARTCRPESLS